MTGNGHGVLVLGASCTGKSSSARMIGDALSWPVVSTDIMARHPGRPWTGVPDPVIAFYLGLSDDTIHWFLKVHHENMRPLIASRLAALRDRERGFVLEGAALRPEYLAQWDIGQATLVCLHVEPEALRARIRRESDYAEHDETMKTAIDKFAERSVRENAALVGAARETGITVIEATEIAGLRQAVTDLAARLSGPKSPA